MQLVVDDQRDDVDILRGAVRDACSYKRTAADHHKVRGGSFAAGEYLAERIQECVHVAVINRHGTMVAL